MITYSWFVLKTLNFTGYIKINYTQICEIDFDSISLKAT